MAGYQYKARKFCLLAVTNIWLKTGCKTIFEQHPNKRKLLKVVMDNSSFSVDPQMNLRFLSLVAMALQPFTNEKLKALDMSELISFIIDKNIHGFRNILESKEPYFIQIPEFSKLSKVQQSNQGRETTVPALGGNSLGNDEELRMIDESDTSTFGGKLEKQA